MRAAAIRVSGRRAGMRAGDRPALSNARARDTGRRAGIRQAGGKQGFAAKAERESRFGRKAHGTGLRENAEESSGSSDGEKPETGGSSARREEVLTVERAAGLNEGPIAGRARVQEAGSIAGGSIAKARRQVVLKGERARRSGSGRGSKAPGSGVSRRVEAGRNRRASRADLQVDSRGEAASPRAG